MVVLFGTMLFLLNVVWHPFEPCYQGRRLSAWAKDVSTWENGDYSSEQERQEALANRDKALEAIRHVGTSALPLALKYCSREDSRLKARLIDFANEQNTVYLHLLRDADYQQVGVRIFEALRPAAKSAIPSLIRLLREKDNGVFNAAIEALHSIGPDAIPLLTEALADPNDRVRLGAVISLGGFQNRARETLSQLIRCLADENPRVRSAAVMALPYMDGDPAIMVHALIPRLKDEDPIVREASAIALGHIHVDAERAVPALIACIEAETNGPVRSPLMVAALGRFGTNARPWAPVLVKWIESNRFGVFSGSALNALSRIDPESAKLLIEKRKMGTP